MRLKLGMIILPMGPGIRGYLTNGHGCGCNFYLWVTHAQPTDTYVLVNFDLSLNSYTHFFWFFFYISCDVIQIIVDN